MSSYAIGAHLVWENGERPAFPLVKVITSLGRNEANDILLDDPKISSFHGNILNREDGFHLLDLKSRNGTLVNGSPITACALHDGDRIAFGDIMLRFQSQSPFPKALIPLARLNQKIQTIAFQSPALRKEADEILREVEHHQEFLKGLVEVVSDLAESSTLTHFADKLAALLTRKLECRSVTLSAEKPAALPKNPALEIVPWDPALAVETKSSAGSGGRLVRCVRAESGWSVQTAFDPGREAGWLAFTAQGAATEPREDVRDLLDLALLFGSVLWRNLQEIDSLHRRETGRLLDEKDRESRHRIESLERRNQELDEFLKQMRNQLVFAEGGPMERVQALARKLASVDLPVLITGETGTGKTYIAKLIHHASARAAKPFVVVDCSTLPANLIESELFGHEKGAFTGAMARKTGKVEACAGGTLFLDEIGDLPLELQGKLLRLVQEGRFERLGGNEVMQVDARIVAATHYDLDERVKTGRFRQDLYYRLHVLPLLMPPLRERTEDIPVLARHFIQKHFGNTAWIFTSDALVAIRNHAWPGNVRELENKLQRAWLFHSGDAISAGDLGLDSPSGNGTSQSVFTAAPSGAASSSHHSAHMASPAVTATAAGAASAGKTLEQYREEYESELLRNCLRQFKGNITRCAEHLQISRNTCKSMLRKYKLVQDDEDEA